MQHMSNTRYIPRGVIPACLLPFASDLAIDERAYRSHLRDLAEVDGVTAITTHAHASEIASLSVQEQRRVLDVTVDEVGDRTRVIAGIYADGSLQAADLARQAARGGADALLIFPPAPFIMGAQRRPEMVIEHFSRIADSVDASLIAFNYALESGQGYTTETLVRLADAVPMVVAIKDWSSSPVQHEANVRALHSLNREFSVLSTHSAWLLSSLVHGADGLLSGSGSVIADLQAGIFRAIQRNDLSEARAISQRLFPITQMFYADPWVDMHNRMKEALVLLGRLPAAYVRPPLMKLPHAEIERIRQALIAGGMMPGVCVPA
ncbi:MAG TPA: dihydrodipicolinate synthase family protein [Chloroflexota bacterium]|nr:dihydrodipicolinate synthase family protein [Chloroflexota bacterium]